MYLKERNRSVFKRTCNRSVFKNEIEVYLKERNEVYLKERNRSVFIVFKRTK